MSLVLPPGRYHRRLDLGSAQRVSGRSPHYLPLTALPRIDAIQGALCHRAFAAVCRTCRTAHVATPSLEKFTDVQMLTHPMDPQRQRGSAHG